VRLGCEVCILKFQIYSYFLRGASARECKHFMEVAGMFNSREHFDYCHDIGGGTR
jgi:hypothetical protein